MKKSNFYVVLLFTVLTIMATMVSCTDAEQSKLGGYGDTFTVKVLGPDTIITYHSTGQVISEQNSDGYYFTNRENGKLIEVSGNIIIEEE
jgi:uncharacterized lipoprotein YehR (DUF1307 family)